MGTRGLTAVIKDGVHRIAQYGQWDHYLSGQGTTVLKFCCEQLNSKEGRERFAAAVDKTRFITGDEFKQLWHEIGVDLNENGGMVSMDKAREFAALYPQLDRDCGAEVLQRVLDGATDLQDSSDFAQESLFCEQGYVVDLDENVMEIHDGWQKSPHARGRYASLVPRDDYYAIMLVAEFALNNLPPAKAVPAIMERLENILRLDRDPDDYADEEEYQDLPSIVDKLPREVAQLAIDGVALPKPVERPNPLKRFTQISRPRE